MPFRKVFKEVKRGVVKVEREQRRATSSVVHEVNRTLHSVEKTMRRDVLPVVLGGGRKKVTTRHTIEEFQRETIQLVLTDDEIVIQPVTNPCASGNHNIVECEIKLEIAVNGGGYVFDDKYCTKCGEHFPFIPDL